MAAPSLMPQVVRDVDVAFPATVKPLMPKYEDIPEEFRHNTGAGRKWREMQSEWFYSGISTKQLKPKDGVNFDLAIRHLKCIQGSFEPKHEHKVAAVAYLASLWFDDWTPSKHPKPIPKAFR